MIYFIQAGECGPIKIGVAENPEARLRQLQTASPLRLKVRLVLDGLYRIEKELHKRFAVLRLQGEWFSPADVLLDFILVKSPSAGRRRRQEILDVRKAQVQGCFCDGIDIYDGTFCPACTQRRVDAELQAHCLEHCKRVILRLPEIRVVAQQDCPACDCCDKDLSLWITEFFKRACAGCIERAMPDARARFAERQRTTGTAA